MRKMMRSTLKICGALLCAVAAAVSAGGAPPSAMTAAARSFLASLQPAQRQKAVYPFESDERLIWHFIPKQRNGLPLKEMSPEQRKAALALLASSLSPEADRKATTIRSLENVLKKQEMGKGPVRDP